MTKINPLKLIVITATALLTLSGGAFASDRQHNRYSSYNQGRYVQSHQQQNHNYRGSHHREQHYSNHNRHDRGRLGHVRPQRRGYYQQHNYRHSHNRHCGHNYRRSYNAGHHYNRNHYDASYYLTRFLFNYSRYDD